MRNVVEAVPVAEQGPAEAIALAPAPPPAPVTGQRRDLEGFLGEQGLVLAAPPQASEGIAPVAEWTPDEVATAGVEAPSTASVPPAPPKISLAAAEGTAPTLSAASVIQEMEAPEADRVAAAIDLVEVPETATPEPVTAADSTRLARVEPVEIAPQAATPAEGPIATNQDATVSPASRLALASTPLPPAAGAVDAPAAVYAQSYPLAVVNGEPLGAVTLRDLGPQGQAVHLGALVGLLKLRMPAAEFAWLSNAAAADQFVMLDRLRAAGITIQFDARDGRLLIDAR